MSKLKRAQKFIGKIINCSPLGELLFYVEGLQILNSEDVVFERKQTEKTLAFVGKVLNSPSDTKTTNCGVKGRLRYKIYDNYKDVFVVVCNGLNRSSALMNKSILHYEELQKLSEKERFKIGLDKGLHLSMMETSWSDVGIKKEIVRLDKLRLVYENDLKKMRVSTTIHQAFSL